MILVTGSTGFLGSNLVKALIATDKTVRCIYRNSRPASFSPEISAKIDWKKADLLDVFALENALEGVDQVYHCAGVVSFQPREKETMYQVNVEGTANLVNLCINKPGCRLLHVSSVAALGRALPDQHIDETASWEDSPNNSVYARSKHDGEMEVWRGAGEGLDIVIVNPSIILGPPDHRSTGSLALLRNVYEGFPWYTKGINGFVDVRDVVHAMIALMDSSISAERFILNGDNWSYQRLLTTMAHYLQVKEPSKYAAPWMGKVVWRLEKVKSWFTRKTPLVTRETAQTAKLKVYYDPSKIKHFLPGFTFTPLEETIRFASEAFLQDEHPMVHGGISLREMTA